MNFTPQRVEMPEDSKSLKFGRLHAQFKVPVILFFDFEALNEPSGSICKKCENRDCPHQTLQIAEHVPFCYSLLAINRYNKIMYTKTIAAEDVAQDLIKTLLDIEDELLTFISRNLSLTMSEDDEDVFENTTICHICQGKLGFDKVRDHDHITGLFLGAAHNSCNLNRKETKRIPIYCHNLRGYDSHFIIKNLGLDKRIKHTSALPSNGQKLKTFTLNSYCFLDSLDFLQGSLSDLVNSLPHSHPFHFVDQSGLYSSGDNILKQKLLKKGIYCYEWADNFEKLLMTKSIPPYEDFFSLFSNKNISSEEYDHACDIFSSLKCKNMMDYTLKYCFLDVILLAEVLQAFREEIMDETGLDCW